MTDERAKTPQPQSPPTKEKPFRGRSMHEDVPTWCDCCTCEPEPRWQQVEDEMEREREKHRND